MTFACVVEFKKARFKSLDFQFHKRIHFSVQIIKSYLKTGKSVPKFQISTSAVKTGVKIFTKVTVKQRQDPQKQWIKIKSCRRVKTEKQN